MGHNNDTRSTNGEILSWLHLSEGPASLGFDGCVVSCPWLAGDPQELGHLDQLDRKPSPIASKFQHLHTVGSWQAITRQWRFCLRVSPGTHTNTWVGKNTVIAPETLKFKPRYSKVVSQSARKLIRWLDKCTLSASFESFPFLFVCFGLVFTVNTDRKKDKNVSKGK